MAQPFLAIDGNRGIYAQQAFAQAYLADPDTAADCGIEDYSDVETLLAGPHASDDPEAYTFAWEAIVEAFELNEYGVTYRIEEYEGDIFLTPEGQSIDPDHYANTGR